MGLKIVFMGTPEFAVASLDAIVKANYDVVGVVTVPDKPAGRGQNIQFSPVKKYALEKGLTILQPEKLKDEGFVSQLKSLKADLFVVVAFRMLPEVVWSMPCLGTFNLHGSLLPQYRGAAPINWAVINGDKETGVTTFFIEKEIDTGKILFREITPVNDTDTAGDVHDRLMEIGAKLVVKTVKAIEAGTIQPISQSEWMDENTIIHPAPKIYRETCRINWSKPVKEIYNLIRGLSPYPAAWTIIQNEKGQELSVKIFETKILNEAASSKPGTIITDSKKHIKIVCTDGTLEILSLQLEGKKRLSPEELLRGFQKLNEFTCI